MIAIGVLFIFNYSTIMEITGLADNEVISRLSIEEVKEESRIYAVAHNIEKFSKSPIFGIGVEEAVENIEYVADTSTSTYLLSIFGIFGGLYTLYWIVGILGIKNKNLMIKIMILIVALLILNKEPHQNILITWCFMFWGLKNIVEKGGEHSDKKDNISSKE